MLNNAFKVSETSKFLTPTSHNDSGFIRPLNNKCLMFSTTSEDNPRLPTYHSKP